VQKNLGKKTTKGRKELRIQGLIDSLRGEVSLTKKPEQSGGRQTKSGLRPKEDARWFGVRGKKNSRESGM